MVLATSDVGAWSLTLHWLAPLFLDVGLTVALSARLPILRAAAGVYGLWRAVLAGLWLVGDGGGGGPLGAAIELLLMWGGVLLTAWGVWRLPRAAVRPWAA